MKKAPAVVCGILCGFAVLVAYLGRSEPASDLAFLKDFTYTVTNEDGESTYRIEGDPAKIVAAVPGASSAKVEITPQGTTYNFFLPSGKTAVLVPARKPNKPSHLIFEDKPTSWWNRFLHRLGIAW